VLIRRSASEVRSGPGRMCKMQSWQARCRIITSGNLRPPESRAGSKAARCSKVSLVGSKGTTPGQNSVPIGTVFRSKGQKCTKLVRPSLGFLVLLSRCGIGVQGIIPARGWIRGGGAGKSAMFYRLVACTPVESKVPTPGRNRPLLATQDPQP
jgi:hypothetical protein